MRKFILLLMMVSSATVFANVAELTELGVDYDYTADITELEELGIKEEKVAACMQEYIKKQSRSYAKNAQQNLYELMHDFDSILSRIYGKKGPIDSISHNEKIELLAKVQCEVYYNMGILK